MAYKIIWSSTAEFTFDTIIAYLESKWTEREIRNFIRRTEETLHLVSRSPYLFRVSQKKNIHEVLITKHNLLLYQVLESRRQVQLLAFFDTRRHPKRKGRLLK